MYCPTIEQETFLLELSQQIQELKSTNIYPILVINLIEHEVFESWENIDLREKICHSKSIVLSIQGLLSKYSREGRLYNLMNKRLELISQDINGAIYNYLHEGLQDDRTRFIRNPIEEWGKRIRVGIESGWLPESAENWRFNYEDVTDSFISLAEKSNLLFLQLKSWLDSSQYHTNISDNCLIRICISTLRYHSKLEDTFEYAKKRTVKSMSFYNEVKGSDSKINPSLEKEESSNDKLSLLNTKQERFYRKLEKWALSLKNPCCNKWITCYLDNGRKLPFHKIHVLKYINDFKSATIYLLDQYERVLGFRNEKRRRYEKNNERYEKKDFINLVKRFKIALEDKENNLYFHYLYELFNNKKSQNPPTLEFPFGYDGTWAHDVEGFSNEDIDTIFDGNPDAYWNID